MKTIRQRRSWKFNASDITVWDNFFTSECLKILKYRVLYGKYWDKEYNNYEAIDYFKDEDYLSELIAKDLRKKIDIPEFQRGWSFRYRNNTPGVKLHCDPSLLTLNVWISSDKSIKDKSLNGVNIYKIKPPKDWSYTQINADAGKAGEYVKANNVQPVHIPHKSNRALLFNGAYFHQSNGISMKEGIENQRISYTMLFGSQLE